ncbi:MAG: aspartyl-tRNA synthetase, partial [uncultured bacterium]
MRTLAAETVDKIGQEVTLQGWVNTRRDHGNIVFLDLRDRSGIVQMVSTKTADAGSEDVIEVVGLVKKRPENMTNPKIPTGTVEVEITSIKIISEAKELPFPIDTDGYDIEEEIRSKYRYLDIRRSRMNKNLRLRSKVVAFIR